eukprot:scaffold31738_cov30-Phaeocystis_antarctica.AAC.1
MNHPQRLTLTDRFPRRRLRPPPQVPVPVVATVSRSVSRRYRDFALQRRYPTAAVLAMARTRKEAPVAPAGADEECEEVPPAKKARASKEEAAKLKLSKAQARLAALEVQTAL